MMRKVAQSPRGARRDQGPLRLRRETLSGEVATAIVRECPGLRFESGYSLDKVYPVAEMLAATLNAEVGV